MKERVAGRKYDPLVWLGSKIGIRPRSAVRHPGRARQAGLARVSHLLTYPEAVVVGLIQGVTELFPVSSLGHNVLLPAIVGGSWATDLNVAASESPYLAFVVGLHVATAIGDHDLLLARLGADRPRFLHLDKTFPGETVDERLCWFLIVATIPVGLVGLIFEHEFRVLFAKPIRAAIFLVVNGLILYAGERFRSQRSKQADADQAARRAELAAMPAAAFAEAGSPSSAAAPGPAAGGRARVRPARDPAAGGTSRRWSPTPGCP